MSRAAVVLALLLIAIATRYFIDTSSSSSPEGIATHTPDLYMINAAITQYGKSGHPRHDIAAVRMNHYPLTNVTTLSAPDMNLYSEKAMRPGKLKQRKAVCFPRHRSRNKPSNSGMMLSHCRLVATGSSSVFTQKYRHCFRIPTMQRHKKKSSSMVQTAEPSPPG